MKISETVASAVVAEVWVRDGIREALATYGLDLDDVIDWSQIAIEATLAAPSPASYEARFVGAISAALIMGIELARSGEAEGGI